MTSARPILLRGQPVGQGDFPLIITPLVGATREALMDELAAILPKRPDMLEWRIDFFTAIGDTAAVIDTARAIKAAAGAIPVLLTRRHISEGGQPIPIDEPAVVALYAAACEARCIDLIDYELSNAPDDLKRLREASAAHGVAMVMSYHNFQLTPDEATLLDRFAEADRLGADVGKVAVMPGDPEDVLRLLSATRRASRALRIPLISMSMGGLGAMTRLMGWQFGSAATFAVGRSSSAPGQIAIEDLRAIVGALRRVATGQ